MTEPVSLVTEKQRECLRLVWRHYDSKKIARELGIKPDAVDGRIKTATRVLGATDRYEAARILMQAEAGADVRSIVYPPSEVPTDASKDPSLISWKPGERQAEHLALEEAQAPYRLTSTDDATWFSPALPGSGRDKNDLTTGIKLMWVATIAIGTALAFGVLASGLEALSRLG